MEFVWFIHTPHQNSPRSPDMMYDHVFAPQMITMCSDHPQQLSFVKFCLHNIPIPDQSIPPHLHIDGVYLLVILPTERRTPGGVPAVATFFLHKLIFSLCHFLTSLLLVILTTTTLTTSIRFLSISKPHRSLLKNEIP